MLEDLTFVLEAVIKCKYLYMVLINVFIIGVNNLHKATCDTRMILNLFILVLIKYLKYVLHKQNFRKKNVLIYVN